MPAYDTTVHLNQYQAVSGDLSYWYLGERGSMRVNIGNDIYSPPTKSASVSSSASIRN